VPAAVVVKDAPLPLGDQEKDEMDLPVQGIEMVSTERTES